VKLPIILAISTSIILLLISFGAVYVSLSGVNNLLIIHFDSYRGIDFLGEKGQVFGILAVAFSVTLINFWLVKVFYYRNRFLAYFLSFFTVFFLTLILITAIVIISVN